MEHTPTPTPTPTTTKLSEMEHGVCVAMIS